MQLLNFHPFLILIYFVVHNLNAQPSPKRHYYELNLSFLNCKNELLTFKTKDSINFFSNDDKFLVSFELIDKLSAEKKRKPINSSKAINSNNNLYQLLFNGNSFLLNHNFITFYNNNPIQKSIIKIKFSKRKKEMIIYLDYSDIEKDINSTGLEINFKKGIYKISNGQRLKIIQNKNK
ncbi:MAG: hypothetical protein ACK5MD_06205 [Flavobacteriales bacterium]